MTAPTPPTPLGSKLHVPVDEARLARVWSRVEPRVTRSVHGRAVGIGALALAAAAAVALLVGRPREVTRPPGPLALASTRASASLDAALREAGARGGPVALSDGSAIELAPGAAVEALENTGARVQLLVRRGRARFSVRPGGPRRWTVEAGALAVEVVGTVFRVERDAAAVQVAVERGRVLVRGEAVPDHVRALTVGESLRVPFARAVAAPAPLPPPVAPREVPPSPPARVTAPVSATVLLAQADEACRAGRIDDALRRLALASRREGDPSAALASYTRGRLLLDVQRVDDAITDLRLALRQGLPPSLEESARARIVEACARVGDREGAARAAAEYRRHHPQGAWRTRVDAWSP
ncbi:MAG: FecR domain-containing protein [Polyangiales bacterium]